MAVLVGLVLVALALDWAVVVVLAVKGGLAGTAAMLSLLVVLGVACLAAATAAIVMT